MTALLSLWLTVAPYVSGPTPPLSLTPLRPPAIEWRQDSRQPCSWWESQLWGDAHCGRMVKAAMDRETRQLQRELSRLRREMQRAQRQLERERSRLREYQP